MSLDFLSAISSLGVGAVLGLVIFAMYRIDRRTSENRLTKLIESDQESRAKNAEALTELTILLKKLNGRARKR